MSLLHGFDISAYQSNTAPSADFVFVKASEGASYTSSRFAAQWASAKTRAKHRGAYHFARPEASSAASQAARFLAVVKPVLEAMMRSVNPKALAADLEACNAFADGATLAAKLHKPALVISATHDKMARAMEGEGLSRLLPEGTYRVIPGAGHMMMVEQAVETANEIRSFLI